MARFTKFGVGRFKSIKDLQSLEVRPVTVLIGANGAGKSNFISYLRLLNSIPASGLQEFIGRQGGADTLLYYGVKESPGLWVAVEFEGKTGRGHYSFSLVNTATDAMVFSKEQVLYRVTDHSPESICQLGSGHKETQLMEGENQFRELWELLQGIQVFHFEDTSATAPIRRRGYIEDSSYLRNNGENLAAFLYGMRKRKPLYYKRIVSTLQQIAPFFEDFDLAPSPLEPNAILLNWRDRHSDHLFGPHQLSDGTLRAMALITLLTQPEEELPGLIVLDEPEIGLHPYAIEVVAALVKSASVHRPVVLATQSVALVNQFKAEDVVTVTREAAQSKFERQQTEPLKQWLEDYAMGEIWEKNLINGIPA